MVKRGRSKAPVRGFTTAPSRPTTRLLGGSSGELLPLKTLNCQPTTGHPGPFLHSMVSFMRFAELLFCSLFLQFLEESYVWPPGGSSLSNFGLSTFAVTVQICSGKADLTQPVAKDDRYFASHQMLETAGYGWGDGGNDDLQPSTGVRVRERRRTAA